MGRFDWSIQCKTTQPSIFQTHIWNKREIRFRALDNFSHKVYLLPDFQINADFSKVFKSMLIYEYLSLQQFHFTVSFYRYRFLWRHKLMFNKSTLCLLLLSKKSKYLFSFKSTFFFNLHGWNMDTMNNFRFHLNTLNGFSVCHLRNHLPDLIHIIE